MSFWEKLKTCHGRVCFGYSTLLVTQKAMMAAVYYCLSLPVWTWYDHGDNISFHAQPYSAYYIIPGEFSKIHEQV